MKTKLLLTPIFIFLSSVLFGQTITNVKVSHEIFCAGSKINVTFDTEGNFNIGNAFIAQLSNEMGSFNTFTNIPSEHTQTSLTATIPNIVQSQLYRLRIVSSSPYMVSPDNAINLTLKAAPSPSFNFQVEGTEVKDRNITFALINSRILFNNTTERSDQCEWTFGDDASMKNYIGCSPPLITYQKEGSKTIMLKVTDGVCIGETDMNLKYLQIVSCNPILPENTRVLRSGEGMGGNDDAFLICPGASFTPTGGMGKVFVETGGNYNSSIIANPLVFLRAGSSGHFGNRSDANGSPDGNVTYDLNASITGEVDQKLLCPSITFDYSLVKCRCDQDCNITTVSSPSTKLSLSLFPNPSHGNLNIEGVDDTFTLAIFDGQGVLAYEKTLSGKSINLSHLNTGFYNAKITDSHGVRIEKLLISR